jgi:hypothetical protein
MLCKRQKKHQGNGVRAAKSVPTVLRTTSVGLRGTGLDVVIAFATSAYSPRSRLRIVYK